MRCTTAARIPAHLACPLVRRLVVLCLGSVLFVACATHQVVLDVQAPATLLHEPPGYETAVVTEVVDGDTVEVRIIGRVNGPGAGSIQPGTSARVRLLGIDTPESVKPGSPVECFGKEATAAAKALLAGEEVVLVKDVEEVDRYQRLLRYVYLGEEMANARLVANGYATAYTYPPNVRHGDLFVGLHRDARQRGKGLWAEQTCNGQSKRSN